MAVDHSISIIGKRVLHTTACLGRSGPVFGMPMKRDRPFDVWIDSWARNFAPVSVRWADDNATDLPGIQSFNC